jgi:hypothetical protein
MVPQTTNWLNCTIILYIVSITVVADSRGEAKYQCSPNRGAEHLGLGLCRSFVPGVDSRRRQRPE